MLKPTLHCPCAGRYLEPTFQYDEPPAGETVFDFGDQRYHRSYSRCAVCNHWFSNNAMDMSCLYGGAYVDNTYGKGLRQTFERIIALPPEQSDNAGRVARLLAFAGQRFPAGKRPRVLDVGSGLAVFPHAIRQAGWDCTALDPDDRAAEHARDVVGVQAVTGDFMRLDGSALGQFDVVTFNKVLEHVEDPLAMLHKALSMLLPGGFVYVEVPDVKAAVEGPHREEFFIEHHHVFSPASVALLAERAGFIALSLERVQEPSSKFTLRGFLAPSPL